MSPELKSHRLTDADARKLASEIIRQWPCHRPFEVDAALRRSPELADHKSAVIDLAYEEFCRARAREPSLAADSFAARFPAMRRTLLRLLEVHDYLEQNVDIWNAAAPPSWPAEGTQFLEFRLVAELGRGAASRVFLAEDTRLADRQVVVKLTPHVEQEASALGRLQHANIVPVFSIRTDAETSISAICMPFLGRATLLDVLDSFLAAGSTPPSSSLIFEAIGSANSGLPECELKGTRPRWSPARTYADGIARIGVQLAEALAYAHRHGVFHCDIKPSNVLVTPDGTAMLLDFNLSFSRDATATAAGGTLPYMPPEQLRMFEGESHQVDARSDVFSLGATLHELLTGQLPFGPPPDAVGSAQLAARSVLALQESQPRNLALEHIDPSIARIVRRCLAFHPADRPSSASELATALRATQRPLARFRRWRRAHRGLSYALACSATMAVLGLATWQLAREPAWDREMRIGREAASVADFATARQHFDNAWTSQPDRPDALFYRGYSDLKAGNLDAAYRDLQTYVDKSNDGRGYAAVGYCICLMGDVPAQRSVALDDFRKALDCGFETAALHSDLGRLYFLLGETDPARKHLTKAISLDPGMAVAHFDLARIELRLALRERRPPDLAVVDRAVKAGIPSPECHFDVAAFYAHAARFGAPTLPLAVEHCRKAVIGGADPEGLDNVASCCLTLNKCDDFTALRSTPPPASPPKPLDWVLDPLQ